MKQLGGKAHYSAAEDDDILRAVRAMLDTPMALRSISNFQKSLPNTGDDSLYANIRKWTRGNSLGWVFDNPQDKIDFSGANIIGFDYTDVIENPQVRDPVIGYLIHRMEELIDGRRFIYIMDEFWKILDGEGGLKEFAKNKQKTIRKQNGMNADKKDYIDGLKLTDSEFQVIKSLDERSRCFLVKQGHASAVCQLNLRGFDDELAVISASTDNIDIMDGIIKKTAERLGVGIDAVRPEDWLQTFYDERKGSGKKASANVMRNAD